MGTPDKCSFCGYSHWPREPHIFPDVVANSVPIMANKPVNIHEPMANGSTYRYRDKESRQTYQREYMRKRRMKP